MSGSRTAQLARLARFDSALLPFAVVFVPLVIGGFAPFKSFILALPLLTSSMCGFVLNDIADVERDRVNHPQRPLPSGLVSHAFATFSYFVLLAISVLWTFLFVPSNSMWPYILYLLILINYNFVVDDFPYLKGITVSFAITAPVIILDDALHGGVRHVVIIISLFFFFFGREILMDVRDIRGDSGTLPHLLGTQFSTRVAFSLQTLSILTLSFFTARNLPSYMITGTIIAVFVTVLWTWYFRKNETIAISIMKLQLIVGIGYLFFE